MICTLFRQFKINHLFNVQIEGAFVDFELSVHCECRAVGSTTSLLLPTALHSQCTVNSKSTKAPSISAPSKLS